MGEKTKDTYSKRRNPLIFKLQACQTGSFKDRGLSKERLPFLSENSPWRQIHIKAGFITSAIFIDKKNNLQKVGAQRKGARGPPRPPQPRPEGPAGPGTHRSGPGQAAAPQWRPRSALTEGPFPPPGSGLRLFLLLLLFSFLLLLLLLLFLCLLLLLFPLLRRACWETEAAGPQGEGGLGCGDRRGGSGFPLRESGVRRDVGINPSL